MFRRLTVGILGAAALAASVLLIRSQRIESASSAAEAVPPGETVPGQIQLERLRELGI